MKVILKEEVDNLGLPGDIVDVAAGYGRNYLIPRGLAIKATAGALKEADSLTRARKAREAKTLGTAEEFRRILESRTLRVPARVDEKGTLYGSVGASEIQAVLKQRGHDIERRRIELHRSIKTIGEYDVVVHVHPQVAAEVKIEVVDAEGKVTLEGLEEERAAARAESASLEERALAAAEEVEDAEAEAEEAAAQDEEVPDEDAAGRPDVAEAAAAEDVEDEPAEAEPVASDTEGDEATEIEDALSARASAPSDVDAPTTPEELVAAAEDDDEETAT